MVGLKHFLTISESFPKYQERGFLCDTVLLAKCGGQMKAHGMLLAAASPVFLSALEAAPSAVPHIIYLPEIELDILQIAVNFIYTGRLLLPVAFSHMDQLSTLFGKMSKMGLSLQTLHGCEMTFIRHDHYSDIFIFMLFINLLMLLKK